MSRLTQVFSLDRRSLALFRILLGIVVFGDLIIRTCNLIPFQTDDGIMPRWAMINHYLHPSTISIHFISGKWYVQLILNSIHALSAVALIVGYRTRLASFICWALMVSLHVRTPFVLQGGDDLIRLLLFWSMFLPLGNYYSVDQALSSKKSVGRQVFGVAGMALMVQMSFVYVMSAVFKDGAAWHGDRTAIWIALQIDQLTTPLGVWFSQFPEIHRILTPMVFWFEALGPLPMFIPFFNGFFRTFTVFAFLSFHLGLAALFELGPFPWVCIAGWVALLPTSFWEIIGRWVKRDRGSSLQIFYDADCGFCKKIVYILVEFLGVGKARVGTAQSDNAINTLMIEDHTWVVVKEGHRFTKFDGVIKLFESSPLFFWMAPVLKLSIFRSIGQFGYHLVSHRRRLAGYLTRPLQWRPIPADFPQVSQLLAFVFFLLVVLWNFQTTKYAPIYLPYSVSKLAYTVRLDQQWNMFSPKPLLDDGWYVIQGETFKGEKVNLWNTDFLNPEKKPKYVSKTYPNQRWRKLFMRFYGSKFSKYRIHLTRYFCRVANQNRDGKDRVNKILIDFMRERTGRVGEKQEIVRQRTSTHFCISYPPPSEQVEIFKDILGGPITGPSTGISTEDPVTELPKAPN